MIVPFSSVRFGFFEILEMAEFLGQVEALGSFARGAEGLQGRRWPSQSGASHLASRFGRGCGYAGLFRRHG
jgi:hypothetical protein